MNWKIVEPIDTSVAGWLNTLTTLVGQGIPLSNIKSLYLPAGFAQSAAPNLNPLPQNSIVTAYISQ